MSRSARHGAIASSGGGGAGYLTTASDYDGNDYVSRGADLTGNSDSGSGIISCSLRLNGGDATTMYVYAAQGNTVYLVRNVGNVFQLALSGRTYNSSGSFVAGATHHPIIVAWSLGDASPGNNWVKMYAGDTEIFSDVFESQLTVDSTRVEHVIGAHSTFVAKLNACLSEVFIHFGATVNPAVEANRRLFFDAAGKPVDKGADGSTPLGVQPLVYLPTGAPPNLGSGGTMTVTGALTVCSTSPTD